MKPKITTLDSMGYNTAPRASGPGVPGDRLRCLKEALLGLWYLVRLLLLFGAVVGLASLAVVALTRLVHLAWAL